MLPSDDRTIKLEREIRELYQRFRWAAVGYLVLVVGITVALVLAQHALDRVKADEQRIARNAALLTTLICDADNVKAKLNAADLCRKSKRNK